MAAGCALADPTPPMPAWVRDREPMTACGDATVEGDGDAPVAMRRCLLSAHAAGAEAELIARHPSPTDGLPLHSYTRVLADGSVEMILHLAPDAPDGGSWEYFRCATLEITDPASARFTLQDCAQTPLTARNRSRFCRMAPCTSATTRRATSTASPGRRRRGLTGRRQQDQRRRDGPGEAARLRGSRQDSAVRVTASASIGPS